MNKLIETSLNIDAPKCKTLNHIRKYPNQNSHITNTDIIIDETVDPYFWLHDKNNSEVIDYLNAENNYADKVMRSTNNLQQELFNEIKARIKETDNSAPWQIDNYCYYYRTEINKEYSIFCRKLISASCSDSPEEFLEEILLDENILASDQEFFVIGDLEVSPCHKYLAYTVDTTGNECYELFIKHLTTAETKKITFDTDINIAPEITWSADSKHLIYITLDNSLRPYSIWSYFYQPKKLVPKTKTRLIFTEPDEKFRVSIERTRSNKYILIESSSQTSTEIYYLPASNLSKNIDKLTSVKPRQANIEYSVDHYFNNNTQEQYFYILINSPTKLNYELFKYNFNSSSSTNLELLIAHNNNIQLESIECFADYAVLYTKENCVTALNIIRNYNFDNIQHLDLTTILSEELYEISAGQNEMYDSKEYIFELESFVTPSRVYAIKPAMPEPDLRLIKASQVFNVNKDNYVTKRLFVNKIPISLIYNKHTYQPNGRQPLLLYGYGSYGISIDPYFSYSRFSLLDRGIAFAIAHIRGGGELGDEWHHQGRLDCKTNTFSDFITAANYLISNKYTNSKKLIIHGGSAGGLLIGNVINQRPDLFNIAIAEVPFVDCLNTMLDPDLPLTINEYEEWGDPNNQTVYNYIKSYAPYENIKPQNYPNLLINNSLNDCRVGFWEAAKWAAKLRANKTNNNILLLKTLMNAGHGGSSGRYQSLYETAFNFNFILNSLD
ncbi:MAG: S9 family peptidase [Gammaproteobacteria bacterium]|nr:S9 family peptidase [Gammaproteobacteria bacterium]